MQTIYNYNENIPNLIILLFCIIILGVLLFFSIGLIVSMLKIIIDLIRQSNKHFFKKITVKQVLLCLVILTICVVLMVSVWFMARLTLEAKFKWIDTDINNCEVVSGNIEHFDYRLEEHRDIKTYYCNILIKNKLFKNFYLGMDNKNVVSELLQNHKFVIYYQEYDEDLFIVRIDKVDISSQNQLENFGNHPIK